MDELHLSDTLQRYFSDVFLCCDEENAGKASLNKTIEVIKSGNVPDDIISQICDICWSQTTNYLNRKQFFSALKLVAAYQANLQIKSDVLNTKMDLPLPRFTWTNQVENQHESPTGDLIELRNDLNDYSEHLDTTSSTDSEMDSDTVRNRSASASSTASDSPTPTNSVQDRNWGTWQGLEEQRQLLEESSDRHSSDEDTEVSQEVWTITNEQREYYTNQFKSLQPDTNALLAGPIARVFFEKSRLPVHELRKIWQLADVTKDGALSLQEFNTAMHLVVLRRNHIELPDVLPTSLIPGNETPLTVSPETEPILSPPQTKDTAKEWTKFIDSPTSSVSSPGPKPVNFDFQKVTLDQDPKILHPKPLRLTPEMANLQQQQQQQQIEDQIDATNDLNSPKKFLDTNLNQNSAIQRPQPKKITLPGPGAIPPPPQQQQQQQQVQNDEGPISLPAFPPPKKEKPPPPPPRPFKTHGRSSSLDLNRLSKLGAPPTVPPRISPNMQTNKKLINQKSEGDCCTTEIDTETPFANFEQFEKYENVQEGIFPGDVYEAERKKLFARFTESSNQQNPQQQQQQQQQQSNDQEVPRKHGAFEIYRKPIQMKQDVALSTEDKAKWDLFRELQDENTVLLRLCQELSQELAEVREQKLALKVKLEKQLNGG